MAKELDNKKIIYLKDWLSVHLELLKEDKLAAYMHCLYTKWSNCVIICNVDSIPEGYSLEDVVNVITGKNIKL